MKILVEGGLKFPSIKRDELEGGMEFGLVSREHRLPEDFSRVSVVTRKAWQAGSHFPRVLMTEPFGNTLLPLDLGWLRQRRAHS